MSANIIELKDVSCKAGCQYLIKNVNWQVKPGEHWIVFGMNGSGKTTLLSVIAGYKYHTAGSVKVFGEEVTDDNILAIRKKIGWVSGSFFDKYYTKESALDIVLSGKEGTLGIGEDLTLADVKMAKKLMRKLALEDKIYYPFDMLSKGERQNTLIARALIGNPDMLILDEPCTGLDVYNRSYLFSTIEELSKEKERTIIYVTHYVEEILPLFRKALVLKNGIVYDQGLIEKVFTKDVFEQLIGHRLDLIKDGDRYQLQIEAKSDLADVLMEEEYGGKI